MGAGRWPRHALLHDENSFLQEVAKSSEFSKRREDTLILFGKAAQQYAAKIETSPTDEETTQVFEQWLYASLGACDLNQVTEDKVPDLRQPVLIRKAILSLPGETAETHGQVCQPVVHPAERGQADRQVPLSAGGFTIVGDHRRPPRPRRSSTTTRTWSPRSSSMRSSTAAARSATSQPFGVFVQPPPHPRDRARIGRVRPLPAKPEHQQFFYCNYGRPTRRLPRPLPGRRHRGLKEQFEVLSITFQTDKVHSRALPEYGWRVTPYAYLLLKPAGRRWTRFRRFASISIFSTLRAT